MGDDRAVTFSLDPGASLVAGQPHVGKTFGRAELRARLQGKTNPTGLDPYQLDQLELIVADIICEAVDRARFLAERGVA